ncbi:hypothetical protein [Croceicoccus sp. BE223]|uniref:hypothetical protein n=1 Tax=Croceicoccus sp. BE223 TaxID=2817716 RepID=UPI00286105F4|nr:hypothetical protein [Croceicoccus sp. BE223]MDR7103575.1 hypothetical protein [Croceicoccus sp. BE223]
MSVMALGLTLASLMVRPGTDEIAQYGNMGPPEENYRPRVVAGWPAPFIADRPAVSVPQAPGPEDTFRGGAFLGSFAFWLWVVFALSCSRRRLWRRWR